MIILSLDPDLTELILVAVHILLERIHKQLQVLRRHDDARMYASTRHARRHASEIDDELGRRMSDDREIRVDAFCLALTEFDLQLCWIALLVRISTVICHEVVREIRK